jgi:hypothetical protein
MLDASAGAWYASPLPGSVISQIAALAAATPPATSCWRNHFWTMFWRI